MSATMAAMLTTLNYTPQNPLKHKLPTKNPLQKPPLLLSFPLRHFTKHLVCTPSPRCYSENRDSFEQYPRPSEIQWRKELCNSVQLIGIVAFPVQITRLSSGKVVASTRLAVYKSATETSCFQPVSSSRPWYSCRLMIGKTLVLKRSYKSWRINLTFWDELAHIAHQHVEKGNQIYVSGRLTSDTVESEDGKQQTYYKVTVQQLNFVERSSPSPVPLYDDSYGSAAAAAKFNSSAPPSKLSIQELWQAFFANPSEWWDNRNNKKNPKYPDFKHKDTGEALWVEGRYNPPWVKSQLEVLDSKMESFQKQDDTSSFNFLDNGF